MLLRSKKQFGVVIHRTSIRPPIGYIMLLAAVIFMVAIAMVFSHFILGWKPSEAMIAAGMPTALLLGMLYPMCTMIFVYEKGVDFPQLPQLHENPYLRVILEFSTVETIRITSEDIAFIRKNDEYHLPARNFNLKKFEKLQNVLEGLNPDITVRS